MRPIEWFDAKPVTWTARLIQLVLLGLVSVVIGPIGFGLVVSRGSVEFEITADELIVKVDPGVMASQRHVAHHDIRSVQLAQLPYGRRTNGTAKPGHCSGWFIRGNLGQVWEASDCSSLYTVVVRTPDEVWTLGPADPEGFADALRSRQPGTWSLPPPAPQPLWWRAVKFVFIAMLAIPILMVAAMVVPIRYGAGDAQLWVRGPFGTRTFRLRGSNATHVDTLGIGLRVFGMGMPGAWVGPISSAWQDGTRIRHPLSRRRCIGGRRETRLAHPRRASKIPRSAETKWKRCLNQPRALLQTSAPLSNRSLSCRSLVRTPTSRSAQDVGET